MDHLTVVRGPSRGTSIALDAADTCIIGSDPDATIRVGGNAPARAAAIKGLKNGGFGLKVLEGPVEVNGEAVEVARLTLGDRIVVGDTEVRFGKPKSAEGMPEELGGFQILGVLGKGGMGTVYRARQVSLDRDVALKVLSSDLTADPEFVGRFQAEARFAARLHHPNVVQVFDVDKADDVYFYSMELMEGGSVETRLRESGRLTIEQATAFIADAARGLAFAEQMRIVHRDIKPDNLMIDRHGHVKLADLGLAHGGDDDSGKVIGTPHFMSPEQIQRQPMDHRSDLYSLGCTYFRLVTGKNPFTGDNVKAIVRGHVKDAAPRADETHEEVPEDVADIIDRLLEKDPGDRYQSAEELLADLAEVGKVEAKRGPWALIAIVAVLAAGGALVWALSRPEPKTIIEKVEDETARKERDAEARRANRLAADNARLAILARGLEGEPLAVALDGMADEHPETEAAELARQQARDIRAAIAAAEAEAERIERAVDAAVAALRAAYQQAVDAGDFPAAHGTLDGRPDNAEVADAERLATTRGELRSDLQLRAAAEIAARQSAVDAALEERALDTAESALQKLAALRAEGSAWPSELLPAAEELDAWIAERQSRLEAGRRRLLRAAEIAAWQRLEQRLLGDASAPGILDAVTAFDFAAAEARLREFVAAEAEFEAAAAITPLLEAFPAATAWIAAFGAAATTDGELAIDLDGLLPESADPEDGTVGRVTRFEPTGAGMTVHLGPKARGEDLTFDPQALRRHADHLLVALPGTPDPAGRGAVLGLLGWAAHLRAADAYLRQLDRGDDATGTEQQAYALHDSLLVASTQALAEALTAAGTGGEEATPAAAGWHRSLYDEVQATRLLARTLRALSARRNLTAAQLAEELRQDHPGTLIVQLLDESDTE